MSGFERSAPVPGDQGVRRSEMVRHNNAPPPMTPWRQEFLEAQRQLEALKKTQGRDRGKGDRSRSRSDSPPRQKKGNATNPSLRGVAASLPPEKVKVLSRAVAHREEGWVAAVARSSENWVAPRRSRMPPPPQKGPPEEGAKREKERPQLDQEPRREQERRRKQRGDPKDDKHADEEERDSHEDANRRELELNEEAQRRELERENQERLERQLEQERRSREIRKKAEEENKRFDALQRERKNKLNSVFALNEDDDDDAAREAELLRKTAERKRKLSADGAMQGPVGMGLGTGESAAALAFTPAGAAPSTVVPSSVAASQRPIASQELGDKLRLGPGLDPAAAFMKLQERKRKGRSATFGGPPRGCSPWRDTGKLPPRARARSP